MKILFVSQYFSPEGAAPAARVGETTVFWAKAGHDVRVLTGFPNYPDGVVLPAYRKQMRRLVAHEDWQGVKVTRTWLWARPNRAARDRALYYFSFFFSALLTGCFMARPDVLVATSPPPFVALAGYILARLKRVPFVFEVRDLWPESLAALKDQAGQSLLERVVTSIVRFLYRKSDHIIAVSPAFKPYLHKEWGVPLEKITVVENGILPDLFSPEGPGRELRKGLKVDEKFVVSFCGTIGFAHGLNTILNAAELLKDRSDIVFLLIGDGAERSHLEASAAQRGLANVRFLGLQPRETIPGLLRASDVCLVLLKKSDVFKTVIPSKMLETMGCGRPAILGVEGQGKEILDAARSGIAIEPENERELADAILKMASDPAAAAQYGKNGREHVMRYYTRSVLADRYIDALAIAAGQGKAAEAVAK